MNNRKAKNLEDENVKKSCMKIYLERIAIIIGIFLYSIAIYLNFSEIEFNADMANMVLEAADIAEGNIFLRDWNLTGLSFITTDLPYFVLGVLAQGISVNAYLIAVTLMFVAMLLSGALLIKKERYFKTALLLYVAIAGCPGIYTLNVSRVHLGCFAWIFVGLFFLEKAEQDKKVINYALAMTLFTLAGWGDSLGIIAIALPVFLVTGFEVLRCVLRNCSVREHGSKLLVAMGAVISAVLLDKLYFIIGGANKNAYLGSKQFEGFENYLHKFVIYLKSLFGLFGADFTGKPIASLETIFCLLRAVIVICGLLIIIYNLVVFFRGKNYDYISVVLSVSFIIVSLICVCTNVFIDMMSARYFAYAPVVFAVLLLRFVINLRLEVVEWKVKKCILLFTVITGTILVSRYALETIDYMRNTNSNAQELVEVLNENNLVNGYVTDFWMGSNVTVISEDTTRVRTIRAGSGGYELYNWFCKNEWFEEDAQFFMCKEGQEVELLNFFGPTENVIEYKDWDIYIYDYDISLDDLQGNKENVLSTVGEDVLCPENNQFPYLMQGLQKDGSPNAFAWTAKEFCMSVQNEKIGETGLRIKVGIPLSAYLAQNTSLEPYIQLYVNEVYIQDIPVIEGIAEYTVLVDKAENDIYKIELITNAYFVPKEIGENEDTRSLSLQIYYIGN